MMASMRLFRSGRWIRQSWFSLQVSGSVAIGLWGRPVAASQRLDQKDRVVDLLREQVFTVSFGIQELLAHDERLQKAAHP